MKVKDVMTQPAPAVRPSTTVAELAELVLRRGAGGAVVIGDGGEPVGVVSERDLVAKHVKVHLPRYLGILGGVISIDSPRTSEDMRHILAVTAGDLMTHDIPTVGPDADVDDVATLMVDRDVNPVVVAEAGQVLGVVSHADIIRLILREESDESGEGE